MTRILVTGSSGLIGRALVAALRGDGVDMVRYDLSAGQDICNPAQMSQALAGCDGVIHLAAISRVAWGESDPDLCRHVNVTGTDVLLQAMLAQARAPWIVFASSREVYGDPALLPVIETAPMQPVNHYGRSKAEGEQLVLAARGLGLRSAIVRLSSVYGTVHDHPDRAVPALLWRAMQGQDLRLSGIDAFFDFVHVDDTVRGLQLAARQLASGAGTVATVHLATGVATSLGALARAVIETAGSDSVLTRLPARRFDVTGFCGDPARAAAVLGWTAAIDLKTGLQDLHKAFRMRRSAPDPVPLPRTAGMTRAA
jgi:nucleoside-diphosphate-sugar epimerase